MASKTIELISPISGQRSAVQVLADLIDRHPQLPDAYIIVHRPFRGRPSKLGLQVKTADCFEQWRIVLGFSNSDVELRPTWLAVDGVHEGIHIALTTHDIWLTAEQVAEARCHEQVSA